MNGILVDSNVIIDVFTEDNKWFDWSSNHLSQCSENYNLYINKVIYSEVSIAFDKIEDLEDALPNQYFNRANIPWEAAFLAGKAFVKYRNRGGRKNLPLPDLFIGAHAAVSGFGVLTRDDRPYKDYFPKLEIISPDKLN